MKPKLKKILGIILQAPLVITVIASFAASIYAAYNHIQGITYGAAVVSGIIIVLYFIGVFLVTRKNHHNNLQK